MQATELTSVLKALPLACLLIEGDGRISAANPAAELLFGPDLVGRPVVNAIRHPDLLGAIDEALSGAPAMEMRLTLSQRSGEVTLQTHLAPLTLSEGRGLLLSFHDITAMLEADQMRRDFVANVSHELKTPLTSVLGFLETLRGPARDDTAARERFLSVMETEALRMNRLVHDLLSLSRVEAEGHARPRGQVDITGLAASVVLSLRPLAEKRRAELLQEMADSALIIPGDEGQLRQMLTNLLENALKYGGENGQVRLRVNVIERVAALRGPGIEITVEDRGPGISEEHLPRLTERFYRVDTHRSREQGGTGLGLAIVKHVVTRHGGTLKIASEPGRGSRFTVQLPAA